MPFDNEKAKKNLEAVFNRMHNDTDLVLLNKYRKLYKKEVSFLKRSWAAAWLLMYFDQRETPPAGAKPPSVSASREKPGSKNNDHNESGETDAFLSEEESMRLFISIGKNRRLYPREVISLISSRTSAGAQDIGAIRILDNYSFVQVRDIKANEIIDTLNGIRFRGRTLAVNFAKPKEQTAPDSE
ncbi:MAG: DbpA RNA binding domain-containing protein [Treponema sp.]|jgi:hypothetical protein|nr:DbpA RNA binding domain-containing protein [Treponema sp.]